MRPGIASSRVGVGGIDGFAERKLAVGGGAAVGQGVDDIFPGTDIDGIGLHRTGIASLVDSADAECVLSYAQG